MRCVWLNTVAAAALAAGLATASAQTTDRDRMEPAQGSAPTQAEPRDTTQNQADPRSGATKEQAREPRADGAVAGDQGKATPSTDAAQGERDDAKSAQTPPATQEQPRERAGSNQDQDRSNQQTQSTAPSKDRATTSEKQGDRARQGERATTSTKQTGSAQKRDGDRPGEQTGRAQGDDKRTSDRADDSKRSDAVRLSERQETSIRQTIERERNLNVVTDVDFSISVGAVIPRSVRLAPIPASIVSIVPAYRDYRYVVVRNEIIIVHPRTYRIVAVVPAEGRTQARATASGSARVSASGNARVQLSAPQRARILAIARSGCTTVLREPDFRVAIGVAIPQQIELCPFEEVLVEEVDVVRPYRYFIVQDEVVLVDPADNTIVEVIR